MILISLYYHKKQSPYQGISYFCEKIFSEWPHNKAETQNEKQSRISHPGYLDSQEIKALREEKILKNEL